MKNFLNVVVAVFVIITKIHAFPTDSNEGRIWPIPEEEDSWRWILGGKAPIQNIFSEPQDRLSSNKPERIHFYLYTQANTSEPFEIDMDDVERLVRSPFDSRNPTSFVIHGWKDDYMLGTTATMRTALLQTDQNRKINFIAVDWKVNSRFENYTISKQLCSTTGKVVAQFIDWMYDHAKLSFDTLTLYGTSMGAHVAGFAGKNVQRGKVHSIIAMDPALPQFPYNNPKERLADTDAEYVESIHTNGGYWGFYQPIGQTAFYPNGGKYQPGCGSDSDNLCSHNRAVEYLVEALSSPEENKFHAVKCHQLEDVEENKCDQYESIMRMGDPNNGNKLRGIYYLNTNSESPYAMGTLGILGKKQEIKKHIQS